MHTFWRILILFLVNMTSVSTEYVLKRCKYIGFLRDYSQITKLCMNDQLQNALVITDKIEEEKPELDTVFNNAERIEDNLEVIDQLDPEEHVNIYITLAHEQDGVRNVKVNVDNIAKVVVDKAIEYSNDITDKTVQGKIIKKFNKYVLNNKFFDDKLLKPYLIEAIIYMYKNIPDTDFQESMLYVLRYNNYAGLKQLVEEHPIACHEEQIKVYPHTKMFEDVLIAIDESQNANTVVNNKKFTRKAKDYSDTAKVNNLMSLQAVSSNMYVVMHGKKNCPIPNASAYQNHDIILSLFKNGVHTVPMDTYDRHDISIQRLIRYLHKLDSFSIFFIHPNLAIPGAIADAPCEDVQPSYDINLGEILAIVYRYIAINFFPYCKIYDDEMEQLGFII